MADWSEVTEILAMGVAEHVFPGAVIEVGHHDTMRWSAACGRLTYATDAAAVSPDTMYDLASLTKVLATTPVAMTLVEHGAIDLDDPISTWVPGWCSPDRAGTTVRDLLEHRSGLPAWRPLYERCRGLSAYVTAIADEPLTYVPRSASLYSDLGFIVLGAVLAGVAGVALDTASRRVWQAAGVATADLAFGPECESTRAIAPARTHDIRGTLTPGDVDDTNAWALGGVAGHAGVFGTAAGVGTFARAMLRALRGTPIAGAFGPAAADLFTRPSTVPGSSRALGWDLMRPTSSCGTRLSVRAFGHTGFTGTSLWIDPARDLYVVLLSNRVHPEAGTNDGIQLVRRAVHDAVVTALTV